MKEQHKGNYIYVDFGANTIKHDFCFKSCETKDSMKNSHGDFKYK